MAITSAVCTSFKVELVRSAINSIACLGIYPTASWTAKRDERIVIVEDFWLSKASCIIFKSFPFDNDNLNLLLHVLHMKVNIAYNIRWFN